MKLGRPKGGKNKKYTAEFKLKIVKRYLDEHVSSREIEVQENINHTNILRWVNDYQNEGVKGLENKVSQRGNRFSALHTSKSLSKEERLELENLKLKIENERLKKGYQVKGAGVKKEYVTLREKNTKSSKN
jgi:transposase